MRGEIPTPQPLEGVFDEAILDLARHQPLIAMALHSYRSGHLSYDEALTKIIVMQASLIEDYQADLLRTHMLRTQPNPIVVDTSTQQLHPDIAAKIKTEKGNLT
ncbi:MAG: hypothetical protein GY833_23085 [Aestuariibacter sp.]|nr:hypothetical protein [Aestuariibacter sp.]